MRDSLPPATDWAAVVDSNLAVVWCLEMAQMCFQESCLGTGHRFKSWSHCLSSNPRLCASISFVCILNKGAPSFLRSMKYESAYEKASTVLGL